MQIEDDRPCTLKPIYVLWSTTRSLVPNMPRYTLIYFNTKGRAEPIRLIFAQAGVEYEDRRVDRASEWPALKPDTPYGTLPVLEVDGKALAGSSTIARYLAEEFGLAGADAFENAQIDSISDLVDDLTQYMVGAFFEKDETRKAELRKELEEKHFPRYLGILSRLVTEGSSGWLFGSKLMWADLKVTAVLDTIGATSPEVLPKYPALVALKDSVEKLPNIAKWIAQRPVTPY